MCGGGWGLFCPGPLGPGFCARTPLAFLFRVGSLVKLFVSRFAVRSEDCEDVERPDPRVWLSVGTPVSRADSE